LSHSVRKEERKRKEKELTGMMHICVGNKMRHNRDAIEQKKNTLSFSFLPVRQCGSYVFKRSFLHLVAIFYNFLAL